MPSRYRARLLRLADGVAGEDADLGDPLAQERLGVVVDAIAHVLVDLADGRSAPTQALTFPPRPDAHRREPRRGDGDPASCAATAAALRRAEAELAALAGPEADPTADLVTRARQALATLAGGLQDHAQQMSPHPSVAARADADRSLMRSLRTAYDLVRADGAGTG